MTSGVISMLMRRDDTRPITSVVYGARCEEVCGGEGVSDAHLRLKE